MTFPSTFRRPPVYVTLEEYARWIGLAESAIFGIVRDDDPDMGCDDFHWNETMRFQLLRALQTAEHGIEKYLKHYMLPRYICDEYYKYESCQFSLRRGKVIALGEKVETLVSANVATGVATLAEEYTLSVTVNFTQCDQVVVYYPGQIQYEIHPSKVVISGTTAQITIPRSRLLKIDYMKDFRDDTLRPHFEDSNVFIGTVDVYRRFPDAAQAITFIWKRQTCGCSVFPCLHTDTHPGDVATQTGAGLIVDARLGVVKVEPATFNTTTGKFDAATWSECRDPDGVLVSYISGINQDCDGNCPEDSDPELARAAIALAHSDLPLGLCACGPAQQYWDYDRFAPKPDEGPTILTPFGTTRGQNYAWGIVKRNAIGGGGLLG